MPQHAGQAVRGDGECRVGNDSVGSNRNALHGNLLAEEPKHRRLEQFD